MLRSPRTHIAAQTHPPHTDVRPHTHQAAPCWICPSPPDLKILRIRPNERTNDKSRTDVTHRSLTNSTSSRNRLRLWRKQSKQYSTVSWHMEQLDILATTAAGGPSRGATNLNTTTAAPIDLTNTAGSVKERPREKVRTFISHFWATRCSDPAQGKSVILFTIR